MQKKTGRAIVSHSRKITDQLCGRLILWDLGTPHEDTVVVAAEYCHRKYDLSSQVEVKHYVPVVDDRKALCKISSIKKTAKRFNESSCRVVLLKKPLLH
jgi:hypothetical protein